MNKNNYLNKLNLLLSQYDMPDETRKKSLMNMTIFGFNMNPCKTLHWKLQRN